MTKVHKDELARDGQICNDNELSQLFDKCLARFNKLKSDYRTNLHLLTELAGEILHADYSLYKKVKGDSIINICVWNAPPDFSFSERPGATISYDVIMNHPEELTLIRDLHNSAYADKVGIIKRLGLKTYLGHKIYFEDECRGMICNMYTWDYQPSEAEKQILKLIASYIGLEESRAQFAESYNNSQTMFRRIVETSNEGILRIDANCKISYVNKKMLQILGCTEWEIIGHELEDWLFPEDLEEHRDKVDERLKGVQDIYERRLRKKDGSEVWLIISASGTFDEKGVYTGSFGMCTDITERKKQEKELKESEERYRLLFAHAPVGIVLHSEGRVLDINPAALKIFGANNVDELLGRPILKNVHPDHVEIAANNIKRMVMGEKGIYPYEYVFLKMDGTPFPVEVYANILTYQNLPSVQIIISDISDRKKTEAIQQRNEEGLKSIINIMQHRSETVKDLMRYTLDEAIRLTASVYGFVFFYNENKQEFEIFTWSQKSYDDSKLKEIPKFFRLEDTGVWGEVVRQQKPIIINDFQAPNPYKKGYPEGHVKIDRFMAIPVYIDGKIVAILGVANKTDEYDEADVLLATLLMDAVWKIVDRKEKEMELRKLSRAVEQSPVSILITDTEGKIEYANDFFTKVTGWQSQEVLGLSPRIFKSGETPPEVYQNLWATISSGKTWKGEFHNCKKNRELYWEEATISPVSNDQGEITHYIAVKEDITKRKQITLELIKAKETAEQMNRLKTTFLASMSHELRTPMVGILGFSELLPSLVENPKAVEMARTIHSSGHRLLKTLNHILDLSRIEADKIEINWTKVELTGLLRGAVRLFKATAARKKISLELLESPAAVYLWSDGTLLEHVLNELIHNAIKYTDSGSVKVSLETDYPEMERGICIKVTDTGIGIPASKHDLIFDAFRQGSEGYERSYEGSGLGLTIAKKYIELLQGQIKISSETGKGSVFCLCFPANLLREKTVETSSGTVASPNISLKAKTDKSTLPRFLLIDDDPVIKELCLHMLEDIAVVEHSAWGEQAMEMLDNKNYAAVLLDISLKGRLSGLEVLNKLRNDKRYRNLPIVALTAYSMLGDKEKFISAGCSHYLSKPFTKDELRSIVLQVLGS